MKRLLEDIHTMLPEDLRGDRKVIVNLIVSMYFRLESTLDQYPPGSDEYNRLEELSERFGHYISDERDADLKEEALQRMFELSISEHPTPQKPTAEDIEFLERVKNAPAKSKTIH